LVLLLLSLQLRVECLPHVIDLLKYKDPAALRACLRLADKQDYGLVFAHNGIRGLGFTQFRLVVFIDIEEVRGVKPCHGEKVVVSLFGELFLETP
jgi:hypothetical protein